MASVAAGLLLLTLPLVAAAPVSGGPAAGATSGAAGAPDGARASGVPRQAVPGGARLVLNHEHVDTMALRYEGGVLTMPLEADLDTAPDQVFDPADVLIQVKDVAAARPTVPDLPDYAFLGAPGDTVWLVPEVQDPDLVWPGWNTEHLAPGVFVDDMVHLHLRDVEGPGRLEVFAADPLGAPRRYFSSTDPGLTTLSTVVGSHTHANWAFSAPGAYTLTFEATATTIGGAEVTTGLVDHRWLVGASITTTTGLTVAPDEAVAGEDVTLTASVDAEAVPGGGWPGAVQFLDGDGVIGEAAPVDGVARFTTDELAAGGHDLSARFVPAADVPHVADAVVGSQSEVVTYTVGAGPGPDPTNPGPDPTNPGPDPTSPGPDPTNPGPDPDPDPTSPGPAPRGSGPDGSDPGDPGDQGGSQDGGSRSSTAAVDCRTPSGSTSTSGSPSGGGPSGDGPGGGGATSNERVVLDEGHVDYGVRLAGGELVSLVKDGTVPGVVEWREPDDVVFHLKPEAAVQVPPGPQFAFLGEPGSTVWRIPQTQISSLLWLGWNTEEISASQVSGPVTWTLDAVDGPGDLAVYQVDSFAQPTVLLDSRDGAGDAHQVPLGTHAHGIWSFSAEGVYRVTFTHRARLASGRTVSDTETVTFAVGAVDPRSVTPAGSGGQLQGWTGAGGAPAAAANRTASTGTDDCRLPRTGTDLAGMLLAGALLLTAGTAAALEARRRFEAGSRA